MRKTTETTTTITTTASSKSKNVTTFQVAQPQVKFCPGTASRRCSLVTNTTNF